jgi:tryptophan 2,3-dioxygenase
MPTWAHRLLVGGLGDQMAAMTYGDYLHLEPLLEAQRPLSEEHDELLFIVIHQSSELWMKLVLHELRGASRAIAGDDVAPALKMLSRVGRIQAQMTQAWEILATMTPADYHRFRGALGGSSGFQSAQYRMIEFILGAKNAALVATSRGDEVAQGLLVEALNAPSLYDETLRLMARRGLAIPRDRLERDVTEPYERSDAVEAAWLAVYRDNERWWDLYDLGEKLVDVEYRLQQWRFAHLKTVERVIGFKTGTGGSAGVPYLARVLQQGFFPELLSLRTKL